MPVAWKREVRQELPETQVPQFILFDCLTPANLSITGSDCDTPFPDPKGIITTKGRIVDMNKYFIAGIMMASACLAEWCAAQELVMGSKAPKLEVSKFIKGEPVSEFEKGKTYVVEFWATWCGPCVHTIPHLTKLQKEYKAVTFIGVAIWEKEQDNVEPFVEKMGDKMDYRVALDAVPEDAPATEGAMVQNWMEPAEQNGIPTAFIINGDGLVAWIGHPGEMDDPLKQIASGKWDIQAEIKKAKELLAEQKKLQAVFQKLNKLLGEFQDTGESEELLKELDAAAAD